ncbi:MAG: phenylalanine--tRNA ligase subunit beta [Candidatus Kapabacteria bacterium]|nr:phenylalanine--tRNA ligase subunit beta [Candidatus Kapabacteria bacterium]MDW8011991.1 phenylalanine--tRNA ligase subunit beta [Bacteroidota bacterium]
MRVSYRWLQDFCALPWTPAEVADILTNLGLEVEAVEDWRGRYAGFVVGVVEEIAPHPYRDGLWVCRVGIGTEQLQIVAGVAPRQGQRAVVALPGAIVPQTGVRIQPREIAGVESRAMLCSRWELMLGEEAEEVWEPPFDVPPGTPLVQAAPFLEDIIYEVALTPNRGDCASHLGIARELAAYGRLPLQFPEVGALPDLPQAEVDVEIGAQEGCSLYACCVVTEISPQEAPLWMQVRLWRSGIRPHTLPVDVMNYVMLELGQPLHAFDYATIAEYRLRVRWAEPGEHFCGLDGRLYRLTSEDLLIADPQKPLALAGVIGGQESQVTSTTRHVLIESALFRPTVIRRTARRHALETEAAYRFQRGVDPQGVVPALVRAAQLLVELGGGTMTAPLLVGQPPSNSRRVLVRYSRVNQVLGVELQPSHVVELAERLGFRVEAQTGDGCLLRVPLFRADISEEIDIVEEVARLYGYDRIPAAESAYLPLQLQPLPEELCPLAIEQAVVAALVEWGFQQVFTPVLIDPATAQQWDQQPVQLVNALGIEASVLRPSLVPSLVRVLAHNVRVGERTVRIFEVGKSFRRRGGDGQQLSDYEERLQLGLLLSGMAAPLQWGIHQRETDFYDLRGVAEQLLQRLRIADVEWRPWREETPAWILPATALRLYCGGDPVGWIGQLRPRVLKSMEVGQAAFVGVLDLVALQRWVGPPPQYAPVAEYPALRRDLAFVADATLPVTRFIELIRQVAGEWLEEVVLFDVYTSPALGEGKRSVAFALRFRSRERTLREEEITPVLERIISEVEQQLGAQLRR